MDETEIIENLLSSPYWLIDVLPKQVSADLYEKVSVMSFRMRIYPIA